ncbi:hypothetical protein GCM10010319_10790 [Streptomyces blastmyceticus]|uniref:Uncharacterized protein n=1 Tax=Streptomyces blastmyceticus TaxID=68180 RepID=A0ABN0WG99_9ACTN
MGFPRGSGVIPDCPAAAGFPADGGGEDDCTPAITPEQRHVTSRRRPKGQGAIVSPPVPPGVTPRHTPVPP